MSIEIYGWDDLPTKDQVYVADLVASYTQGEMGEKPQMLPVTAQEVQDKFMAVIATSEGVFAGYAAAAQPASHVGQEMSEVGSLWVPSEYRGQGIAHKLVQQVSEKVQQRSVVPFAFCNPLSVNVFLNSGYAEAAPEEIPVEAFSLCASCPMKPVAGCCDTTVVYKGDHNEQ